MVVHIFCYGKTREILRRELSAVLLPLIIILLMPFSVIYADADTDETSGRELAIQKMKNGFYNFEESIDLTECGVTPKDIGELFIFVIKNDPYLFFVDTKLSYIYKNDGSMFKISPKYNTTPQEAAEMIRFCADEAERLAGGVDPRLSDAEKALAVHDLLCSEYKYDTSYANDDMFKFLTAKTGTCQGYAWTYMAILKRLEIECCYVASDSINHIWNMVKIDGEWYHCDLTWDDSTDGKTDRRHFLCSDSKAQLLGHRDWYSAYGAECSSTLYDDCDFDRLTHNAASGDGDHSREVDLYDLLLVRMSAHDIYNEEICHVCADVNKDMVCDDRDVRILRQKILNEQ